MTSARLQRRLGGGQVGLTHSMASLSQTQLEGHSESWPQPIWQVFTFSSHTRLKRPTPSSRLSQSPVLSQGELTASLPSTSVLLLTTGWKHSNRTMASLGSAPSVKEMRRRR